MAVNTGVNVTKLNAYAVEDKTKGVNLTKAVAYVVLILGPGDVLAPTLAEVSSLTQQSSGATDTLAATIGETASISITGIVNFSVTETLAPALLGVASTTIEGGGPVGIKGNKMIYHF